MNCSPASERKTLRVVRWNSRTQSRASNPATALLTLVADTPSSIAAARKPPRRATAITVSNSTRPDRFIVLLFASGCHELSVLSGQCSGFKLPAAKGGEKFMRMVERIYIDGAFVTPHGTEMFDLFD